MPDRAKAALDLMAADIERFRQLVEDLLEISRFDAGVMHLDLEEVRVDELVMQAVTASTDVDVTVDIDADLAGVVVKADKRRLSRVIANLLDNAGQVRRRRLSGSSSARRATPCSSRSRTRGPVPAEDREPSSSGSTAARRPGTGAASTASASAWPS